MRVVATLMIIGLAVFGTGEAWCGKKYKSVVERIRDGIDLPPLISLRELISIASLPALSAAIGIVAVWS